MAAGARSSGADVRHDHTGKAGRIETLGDDVRLELSVRRNTVRPNGLPEGVALDPVSVQGDVSPSLGALQVIGALEGKRLGAAGGFSLGAGTGGGGNQLARGLCGSKAA